MYKIFLLCFLIIFGSCARYVSVSKPVIDTTTDNQYLVVGEGVKYEGDDSVKDINKNNNKYDTILIEDDETYYYLD